MQKRAAKCQNADDSAEMSEKELTEGVQAKDASKAENSEKGVQNGEKTEENTAKSSENGTNSKQKSKENSAKDDDLSEEDQLLIQSLEMLLQRLSEPDETLHKPALNSLIGLIRTSTSSMTSVPKPLKYLQPHFGALRDIHTAWFASGVHAEEEKNLLSEVLSVASMTFAVLRNTLHYRLLVTTQNAAEWGHEYIRHLTSEIGEEFQASSAHLEQPHSKEALVELAVKQVAPFLLSHNAEADAVDLLLELESITQLPALVAGMPDDKILRVGRYMMSCVPFLSPPEDISFMNTTLAIYLQAGKITEALVTAIKLNSEESVMRVWNTAKSDTMRIQMAFILARSNFPLPEQVTENQTEAVKDALSKAKLSEYFLQYAKELDVMPPKSIEEVYKVHLEGGRSTGQLVESARANLASTFVNAFVNAGFSNDKLVSTDEESKGDASAASDWIYKNKESGQLSASASIGLTFLWNTEVGLNATDKYTYSENDHIKAGSLLSVGLMHANLGGGESDAPIALLLEYVDHKNTSIRVSAIMGLGFAYAGTRRADLQEILSVPLADESTSMEVAAAASLALGFIFVGSADGDITSTLLESMMSRPEAHLSDKWIKFMILGLGLLYLGRQDVSDALLETVRAIDHPVTKSATVLIDICAYAGTSNVLKVQEMLHHCADHIVEKEVETPPKEDQAATEKKSEDIEMGTADSSGAGKSKVKEDDTHQIYAVIGIALIAMGEDVGSEMSLRQFSHLMHYGEPTIRRTVPLALGLLSASNPQLSLLDALSKYSHDTDLFVAQNAIFAMGLIGAGSNNARLAQMLRGLAGYYAKEADTLFVVRISQGMIQMGKGTIGLSPFHTDRQLISPTAIAGLLATIIAFTDIKSFILDQSHWLLYCLTLAMFPRFLITLDEDLNPVQVVVRVGLAVDTVGQAGKPRTISGFQTHTTPVRLGHNERAELASEQWLAYPHILEGVCILRKNPGYSADEKMEE